MWARGSLHCAGLVESKGVKLRIQISSTKTSFQMKMEGNPKKEGGEEEDEDGEGAEDEEVQEGQEHA